jgi:hypothetical protein
MKKGTSPGPSIWWTSMYELSREKTGTGPTQPKGPGKNDVSYSQLRSKHARNPSPPPRSVWELQNHTTPLEDFESVHPRFNWKILSITIRSTKNNRCRNHPSSHTNHTNIAIMARGEAVQPKIHYKGQDEDFVVFVDDAKAAQNWKTDKTIPLAHIVSSFKVFVTHK